MPPANNSVPPDEIPIENFQPEIKTVENDKSSISESKKDNPTWSLSSLIPSIENKDEVLHKNGKEYHLKYGSPIAALSPLFEMVGAAISGAPATADIVGAANPELTAATGSKLYSMGEDRLARMGSWAPDVISSAKNAVGEGLQDASKSISENPMVRRLIKLGSGYLIGEKALHAIGNIFSGKHSEK